jgi:anti-anti-sigma factor
VGNSRLFRTEIRGDTLVVVALGNISSLAGKDADEALDKMILLLEEQELKNVVIDLGHAEYFGTLMIELLHRVWRAVRNHAGRMAICNVSDLGREILDVSKLDHLWEICPSREGALGAVDHQPGKLPQSR